MDKSQSGNQLLESVFGEEINSIWDIEDHEKVTDFKDTILSNEDWYNYHKVTFQKDGKTYSIRYRSHASDNVCDEEVDYDSFTEEATTKHFTVSTAQEAEDIHRTLQQALQNGSTITVTVTELH